MTTPLTKAQAIQLLGGSLGTAAQAIGISKQAVCLWPDPLPRRIQDRVEAALARTARGALDGHKPAPACAASE